MFKLSNGIVDEDEVAAVLKNGPNHQVVLKSGYVLTVHQDEAAALTQEIAPSSPAAAGGKK